MKKFMTFALVAIFCAMSALAAGNFGGRKVYVSPGHGTWLSEDRNCVSINHGWGDTNGFWESNTDLWKGLRMGYLLSKYGAQVKYSRVKNGDYSMVGSMADHCAACQRWGAEAFVEIHSNAAAMGSTANFGLVLYRGTDGNNYVGGSQNLGNHIWNAINENNNIDPKSAYITSANVRGDVSFYGGSVTTYIDGVGYTGYLGALRHGRPGVLIEGFFHTYYPSLYRALNPDYCRMEGTRYYRRVATYFGVGGEDVGYICGVLRDSDNGFSHQYYIGKDGTLDAKAPINGGTVKLYTEDGDLVKTYTTNNEYNGVFVFDFLNPGKYIVQANKGGFGTCTQEITVKANETVYPVLYMKPGGPIEPEPAGVDATELWSLRNYNGTSKNSGFDATKVNAMEYFNGRLFCVFENSKMYVLSAKSGKWLGEMNIEGVTPAARKLCDVKQIDGDILACNLANNGSGQPLKVYHWSHDVTKAPDVMLETTNLGGAGRLGFCLGYSGSLADGKLLFIEDDGTTSRLVSYKVTNGKANPNPTTVNITKNGGYCWLSDPVRIQDIGNGKYRLSGKHCGLLQMNENGQVTDELIKPSCDHGNAWYGFSYKGKNWMAISSYKRHNNKDFTGGYISLINITNNWNNSERKALPADGLAGDAEVNEDATQSLCCEYDGNNYVYIWLLTTTQGITCFHAGTSHPDLAVPVGDYPNLYLMGTVNNSGWGTSPTEGLPAYQYQPGKYYATIQSDSSNDHCSFAFTESIGDWWEITTNRWTGTAEPLNVNAGGTYPISYQSNSGNRYDLPTGKFYADLDLKEGTMKIGTKPNVFFIAVDKGFDNQYQRYRTDDSTRACVKGADGKYYGKGIYFPPRPDDGSLSYFSLSTIITRDYEDWGRHGIDRWGAGTGTRETLTSGKAGRCVSGVDDACYYVEPGTYDVVIDIENNTITLTRTFPKELYIGGQAYGNNGWFIDTDHVVRVYNAGNGKYYGAVTSNGDSEQRFAFIDSPERVPHRFSSGIERDEITWGSTKSIREDLNTKTDGCFSIRTAGTYYLELDLVAKTMKVSDKPFVFLLFYDTSLGGNQNWNTQSIDCPIMKIDEGLYSAHQVVLTKSIVQDYARFSFTTTPGMHGEDWTRVKYDRWGNPTDTYTLTNNVAAAFARNPEGVLQIAPGTYRVTIDTKNNTVKLTNDDSSVEDIVTNRNHKVVVIGDHGEIAVLGDAQDIKIYSIDGQLVASNKAQVAVPQGSYIVKVDGVTTKVLVK